MQGPSSTLFPPGQPPATAPRTMRDLAAALYRQAGLVAVCVLVGTAASLVLYANQPRVYTSTAKVWVQTEQQGSPSFLSGIAAYRETPYPDPVNRKIETEMELMLTRTNAQAVVDKLHIRDEQLARGTLGKLRGLLGGGAAATPAASPADSRSHTVDLFLDGVSVEPLRSKTADTSSNVLEVEFQCADPALAPVALQAFLDNYLQLGAQQNRRLGETTSRVIAGQLAQAKDDLRQAEDRIVQLLVQDSGRSGWFYRVIETGQVQAGDDLVLLERPHADWPLPRLMDLLYRRTLDQDELRGALKLPLGGSWQRTFERRLEQRQTESWDSRLQDPQASTGT